MNTPHTTRALFAILALTASGCVRRADDRASAPHTTAPRDVLDSGTLRGLDAATQPEPLHVARSRAREAPRVPTDAGVWLPIADRARWNCAPVGVLGLPEGLPRAFSEGQCEVMIGSAWIGADDRFVQRIVDDCVRDVRATRRRTGGQWAFSTDWQFSCLDQGSVVSRWSESQLTRIAAMEHATLENCYQRHRADGGTATGQFILAWVVAADGSVEPGSSAASRYGVPDAGAPPLPREIGSCGSAELHYPRGPRRELRWLKATLYGSWPVRDI